MNQLTAFDAVAMRMFRYANLSPTTNEVMLLANDLELVANEFEDQSQDDDSLANHAAHVLRSRIGGYANLRSYVNTLLAGQRRELRGAL